mgnify:CR=1 FL=1|jgi:hypothetical protein
MNRFSFKKGWVQVPKNKSDEVRNRIMVVLGLQARNSFYIRLRGAIEPKVSEAQAIEKIFAMYGITDIWGDE